MEVAFYIAAAIAVVSTFMVIIQLNAVHALMYLIVSLLAVALVFFILGAPFIAALEVIIYAGAIMVLFVFVVMMLNLGPRATEQERRWVQPGMWAGPSVLALLLLAELLYLLTAAPGEQPAHVAVIEPRRISMSLFGPYLIGVELASLLLLPGLIGAYHIGRRFPKEGE